MRTREAGRPARAPAGRCWPNAYAATAPTAEPSRPAFETVKATFERGENIKLTGFGNFVVLTKNGRGGRNPQTGGEAKIAPRRVLSFKPSAILKSAVKR